MYHGAYRFLSVQGQLRRVAQLNCELSHPVAEHLVEGAELDEHPRRRFHVRAVRLLQLQSHFGHLAVECGAWSVRVETLNGIPHEEVQGGARLEHGVEEARNQRAVYFWRCECITIKLQRAQLTVTLRHCTAVVPELHQVDDNERVVFEELEGKCVPPLGNVVRIELSLKP